MSPSPAPDPGEGGETALAARTWDVPEPRRVTVPADSRTASGAFVQGPHARLDYAVDWTDWLDPGEVISESEWSAPAGLSVSTSYHDGRLAVVWLTGGELGATYQVANTVTTGVGRREYRRLRLVIRQT